MKRVPVITIDGPSGSGKGTISRQLAHELGWHFLDSGALYRLVGLGAAKNHIKHSDIERLVRYAADLDVRFDTPDPVQDPTIWLEGEQVGTALRTEQCGNLASQVAALGPVREALLIRQRAFAKPPGLVADGRDMGTTVFPEALVKIFLTASPEERARRRHKQLKEKGFSVSLSALIREIAERDARDSSRPVSPLKPADDAVIIDTSVMDISEVMVQVKTICQQRGADAFH